MDQVQKIFNTLSSSNNNSVEKLVKWLQEGVVEKSNSVEKEVTDMFSGAADKKNVTFQEFQGALQKLAASKNTTIEAALQKLAEFKGFPDAAGMLNQATAALGFK